MAIKAGVWIDHKKAVVVLITDKGEETRRVRSGVGQPGRATVRSRSEHKYGPNDFVAEDRIERKFMDQLNKYYDEVITCIHDAESILILGPGEAKGEFKKRIKGKKLRGRVAELETADKMTDRQFAANVRQHFAAVPGTETKNRPSRKRSPPSPNPRKAQQARPGRTPRLNRGNTPQPEPAEAPPNPGKVPRDVGGEG